MFQAVVASPVRLSLELLVTMEMRSDDEVASQGALIGR